jgi:hypothetical protein
MVIGLRIQYAAAATCRLRNITRVHLLLQSLAGNAVCLFCRLCLLSAAAFESLTNLYRNAKFINSAKVLLGSVAPHMTGQMMLKTWLAHMYGRNTRMRPKRCAMCGGG